MVPSGLTHDNVVFASICGSCLDLEEEGHGVGNGVREWNWRLGDGGRRLDTFRSLSSALPVWPRPGLCFAHQSRAVSGADVSAAVASIHCHLVCNPHQLLPAPGVGLWSVLVLSQLFIFFCLLCY